MNRKKFSFFISSLDIGGVERVFVNLVNSISRKGFDVDLVLARESGPYLSLVSNKVNVVDLRSSRALMSLIPLVRYLRKEKPDLLMSAKAHYNIVAIWAKYLSGVPCKLLITQHGYFPPVNEKIMKINARLIPFLARLFYKKADKIICVSQGLKKDLAKTLSISEDKIDVIYNPIFEESILEKTKESTDHHFFVDEKNKIILGSGRLVKEKDFPTLIKAFYELRRKEKNIRLIILGEGEERKKLEKLIEELGLKDNVSMPGFVNNPYPYIKRSNVFVSSSRREGFGNVLVEAMACGTPIVSTNCLSGPAELLKNGEYGKLIPVGDVNALAKAIGEALKSPIESKKLISRSKDFSVDKVTKNYLMLFKEVLDQK